MESKPSYQFSPSAGPVLFLVAQLTVAICIFKILFHKSLWNVWEGG